MKVDHEIEEDWLACISFPNPIDIGVQKFKDLREDLDEDLCVEMIEKLLE